MENILAICTTCNKFHFAAIANHMMTVGCDQLLQQNNMSSKGN